MNSEALQRAGDRGGVGFHSRRKFALRIPGVGNSQASTCVDVADVVSRMAEGLHERRDSLHRLAKGIDVEYLRADVDADSGRFEMAGCSALTIEFSGVAHRDSELV